MKKVIMRLTLAAICATFALVSCKNDAKPAASTAIQADTTAVQATSTAATAATMAKATADSIAMAEAAALAVAKEDSIAKVAAAKEAAAKAKGKVVAKPTTKPTTKTTNVLPKKVPAPVKIIPAPAAKGNGGKVVKRKGKDDVFEISEIKPAFPGGDGAMMKFLNKNIKYPTTAKENGIKGTVFMRFVVEKDGSVGDVEVAKGVNPLLDAEAKRVVASMPKWAAGKQNGTPVAVQYTLPVKFELIE